MYDLAKLYEFGDIEEKMWKLLNLKNADLQDHNINQTVWFAILLGVVLDKLLVLISNYPDRLIIGQAQSVEKPPTVLSGP